MGRSPFKVLILTGDRLHARRTFKTATEIAVLALVTDHRQGSGESFDGGCPNMHRYRRCHIFSGFSYSELSWSSGLQVLGKPRFVMACINF